MSNVVFGGLGKKGMFRVTLSDPIHVLGLGFDSIRSGSCFITPLLFRRVMLVLAFGGHCYYRCLIAGSCLVLGESSGLNGVPLTWSCFVECCVFAL